MRISGELKALVVQNERGGIDTGNRSLVRIRLPIDEFYPELQEKRFAKLQQ